jgi:copper chaperone CopZ
MRHPLAAILIVMAVAVAVPARASAQIDEVRIVVNGLTCNLCAAGLERSLRKLDVVSKVRVSLDEETALVTLKPGARFDADRFRAAVTDAGQDTRQVELRLRGAVRQQDGAYSVEARPGLLLAFSSSSASRLQQYNGKTIRARARVSSPIRSPLELDLIAIE